MASSNFVLRQADGKISRVAVPFNPLGPNEVRVKIIHSGLCSTDHSFMRPVLHLTMKALPWSKKLGSLVMEVKIGDRVGGEYYSVSKCAYLSYATSIRHDPQLDIRTW